jgi:SAM-dependent methyltransferase
VPPINGSAAAIDCSSSAHAGIWTTAHRVCRSTREQPPLPRWRDDWSVQVGPSQYATEDNLAARQRLWKISPRLPPFSLFSWLVDLARLHGGERVLEVGCGNGAYLEYLDAVGLDLSMGILASARGRARGPLVAGDAIALPFANGSFDFVLAAHMLYHVVERSKAVSELRRVLRGSGRCIAVTNGERNMEELVRIVEGVGGHGWKWRRSSAVGFSLENGADQLRVAFDEVDKVDCPDSVVQVTDAHALGDYLRSVGDTYESQVISWTTWDWVVEECQRQVAAVVESEGVFRLSSSMGAFVCW